MAKKSEVAANERMGIRKVSGTNSKLVPDTFVSSIVAVGSCDGPKTVVLGLDTNVD